MLSSFGAGCLQEMLATGRLTAVQASYCLELLRCAKVTFVMQSCKEIWAFYYTGMKTDSGKTLPLPGVFHCLRGYDTAFAWCVPLLSWLRHRICLVCSTAFMTETVPFLAVLSRPTWRWRVGEAQSRTGGPGYRGARGQADRAALLAARAAGGARAGGRSDRDAGGSAPVETRERGGAGGEGRGKA